MLAELQTLTESGKSNFVHSADLCRGGVRVRVRGRLGL